MQRPSSHQPNSDGGELDSPRFGPSFKKLPLLPYERALIASIGITETEYEEYLKFVKKKSQIPAGTITAGPVLIPTLVSLAVGVLFTAVGYLLAPKPKAPKEGPQIKSKQGDSERGRTRFSPTFGFDTQTDLGEYGTSIPIHFGQQQGDRKRDAIRGNWPVSMDELFCTDFVRYTPGPNRSGGMVISPVLVWSRMYSLGRGQLFQGMYVVGEKMDNGEIPDLEGIWLGNNTLDKLSEKNYAFYWDNEGSEGRLRKTDIRHGTHGQEDSGNPFLAPKIEGYRTWAEPFPTPLCNRTGGSGFCMAYSLSNQSTFGCYAPIMNGVDRRPNWRVISLPNASDEGAEVRTKLERTKISGGEDRMEASGRGYGRLMGLAEWNGTRKGSQDTPRWTAAVNKGDKVRFNILKKRYDEELYKDSYKNDGEKFKVEVSVEDLVNESEADRAAADDALQLGEEFMINKSRFRVVERSNKRFEMERDGVDGDVAYAILECIEDRERTKYEIGFVSEDYFERDIPKKDSKYSVFDKAHVPPHWSPLVKYEIGSFRNLRPAEVTEIGIKSRVYAQMNGMCNFPTIPTSNELRDQFDKQNVTFQNGVQSQYFTRYSFFTLYMRSTEQGDLSDPSTFKDTEQIFAIRGNEPVDQYNYIAIKPQTVQQYEYRLYPLNSGWCSRVDDDAVAWELDVANGDPFTIRKSVSGVGNVEISGVGRLINIKCAWTSPLMLGKRDSDYKDNENAYCPLVGCEPIAPENEWEPVETVCEIDPYEYFGWRAYYFLGYGLQNGSGFPTSYNSAPIVNQRSNMYKIPAIRTATNNGWTGPYANDGIGVLWSFNKTATKTNGAASVPFTIQEYDTRYGTYETAVSNSGRNLSIRLWNTGTQYAATFRDTISTVSITGYVKLYRNSDDYNNDTNYVIWEGTT